MLFIESKVEEGKVFEVTSSQCFSFDDGYTCEEALEFISKYLSLNKEVEKPSWLDQLLRKKYSFDMLGFIANLDLKEMLSEDPELALSNLNYIKDRITRKSGQGRITPQFARNNTSSQSVIGQA